MTPIDCLFEESKLSIEQLAAKSSLSPKRVEAIVLGRWLPSPVEREKLANALGRAVEEIGWGHTMTPRNVRYHRFGLREDF